MIEDQKVSLHTGMALAAEGERLMDAQREALGRPLIKDLRTGKEVLLARIDSDFAYHSPKPGQPEIYYEIRETARLFAKQLVESVPMGRELSTALTKLEECVFHANAGIARHG